MQSNASDVTTQSLAELRVYTTVPRYRNITAFLGCLENETNTNPSTEDLVALSFLDRFATLSRTLGMSFCSSSTSQFMILNDTHSAVVLRRQWCWTRVATSLRIHPWHLLWTLIVRIIPVIIPVLHAKVQVVSRLTIKPSSCTILFLNSKYATASRWFSSRLTASRRWTSVSLQNVSQSAHPTYVSYWLCSDTKYVINFRYLTACLQSTTIMTT